MYSAFFLSLFLVNGIVADPSKTIVENAVATEDLSTLVTVLSAPGYEPLLEALNGPGTFTVFAPNNNAFAKAGLDPSLVEEVTAILNYHVLGSVMTASQLQGVLFPETLSANPKYVSLGGKGQVLFIVGNDAGVNIYFENFVATVVVADVICSNGVVHIIDLVLELPNLTSQTVKFSGLSDLLEAVLKTDLVDAVDTTEGITLFAPTNKGFDAAGINVTDTPIDVLTDVLKYHVVPAVAYTTDIEDGMEVPTLQGGTLTLTTRPGSNVYEVNGYRVTVANVLLKNGVAHFIDNVLIPK